MASGELATSEIQAATQTGSRPAQRGRLVRVTDDVFCLQQSLVNVIFVGEPGSPDRGWTLVDAGLFFSASQIQAAAAELYGADSRPSAIVLTHAHFDHVGAAKALADRWSTSVWAHRLEMPYLTGRASYPPADPTVGGGMMSLLSPLYPRGPFNLGDRVQQLPEDYHIPGLPQWRWVPTPGHSPGHVSLFRESDRTLIAGDAFVTVKQESALAVMAQITHVQRPPAYFTQDWQQARDSVTRLAALQPIAAITGHGKPMYGHTLQTQLNELVSGWEEAQPSSGRYVHQPAIFNDVGPVAVPPPNSRGNWQLVAGLGACTLLGIALMSALRREQRH